MVTRHTLSVAGVLALGLLAASLMRPLGHRFFRPAQPPRRVLPPPPRTPSEAARRTAHRHWARAQQAVNEERYALEAWDPAAIPPLESEAWRRQLTVRDRSGELRRALGAARQAWQLARTPDEAYLAALLRLQLESEAGHLEIELSQAEWLMQRHPHDLVSLMCLRRVERDREWGRAARGVKSSARAARSPGIAPPPAEDRGTLVDTPRR